VDGAAVTSLGDGPIEQQHRAIMNALASGIDDALNPQRDSGGKRTVGFVLLVFPFNSTDGRCNYISNGADRKDIVVMLKEQIARFEGQPEMLGRA
jgi:hypothetical protein